MRQFDVMVGNPPYQDSSHTEKKNTLWRKFLHLSITKHIRRGGYLAFITPSSWAGSSNLLNKYFLPHNIIYLNKDECRKHFPGVGSTFSYYILQLTPYQNKTFVVNKQPNNQVVTTNVDLFELVYGALPRDLSGIGISIVKKYLIQIVKSSVLLMRALTTT